MTDTRVELLSCPFCGSAPLIVDDDSYEHCQIFCIGCEIEPCVLRPVGKFEEAVAVWNRRAAMPAVPTTERVEAALCPNAKKCTEENVYCSATDCAFAKQRAALAAADAVRAEDVAGLVERLNYALNNWNLDDPDEKAIFADTIETITHMAWEPGKAVFAFAEAITHGDDVHRAWLRTAAEAFVAGGELPPPSGLGAADTIARLSAQVETLTRERDDWQKLAGANMHGEHAALVRAEKSKARVAELEAALDFYACVDHYPGEKHQFPDGVSQDRGKRARATLTKGDDDAER